MRELDQLATTAAAAASSQSQASREIGSAVVRTAETTKEVSTYISGLTGEVAMTGRTAVVLRAASDDLAQRAEIMHHEVDGFLKALQAA